MNKKAFLDEVTVGAIADALAETGGILDPTNPTAMAEAIGMAIDVAQIDEAGKEGIKSLAADPALQQQIMDTAQQRQSSENPAQLRSGIRETLYSLNNIYAKEGFDVLRALRVWKEARLNPAMIRDQIRDDVGHNVSLAEAKALYKIGSELQSGITYEFGKEQDTNVMQQMNAHRVMKFTPNVRASVEKIGQNLYRTKRANVLWKIDMKDNDDGSQIPYLVRVDSVSANDGDENVKEGL